MDYDIFNFCTFIPRTSSSWIFYPSFQWFSFHFNLLYLYVPYRAVNWALCCIFFFFLSSFNSYFFNSIKYNWQFYIFLHHSSDHPSSKNMRKILFIICCWLMYVKKCIGGKYWEFFVVIKERVRFTHRSRRRKKTTKRKVIICIVSRAKFNSVIIYYYYY